MSQVIKGSSRAMQSNSIIWHSSHPSKRLIFPQAAHHQSISSQSPIQSQSSSQCRTFPTPVAPSLPAPTPNAAAISIRTMMGNMENVITEFSGRVDALVEEVKQAQSEVVETSRVQEESLAEVKRELQSHVSGCHSSLQTSVAGNRSFLEKVLDRQSSLSDQLTSIEERLRVIDARMAEQEKRDGQMQSQIQEMATQLLKILIDFQSLSPILPSVQALPLHVQTAKNDVVNFVRQELAISSTALSLSLSQAVTRLEGLARPNPIQELAPPSVQLSPFNQSQHDFTVMRDQVLSFLLLSQPTAVNTPKPSAVASSSLSKCTPIRSTASSSKQRLVTFEESDDNYNNGDDHDSDVFPSLRRPLPALPTMMTRSTRARKVDANHIYSTMPPTITSASPKKVRVADTTTPLPRSSPYQARPSTKASVNRGRTGRQKQSKKPQSVRARRTLEDSPMAGDAMNVTDWI
ncbi:hypothetical protein FRB94_012484 [Tulasnella sp. JGI-2019a]|nr:hypothetical protein FRB94_012484 [Tulasnella sp. JGI-2019a]